MYSKKDVDDLDVSKTRIVYSDSDIYKWDSVLLCKSAGDDINLYLHSASGSHSTYMIKNTGWGIVYVNLSHEDTFDLDIGDEWMFTELFPCESILITDQSPKSWVMLDFHFFWEFRKWGY
jgi:hypothetical protein